MIGYLECAVVCSWYINYWRVCHVRVATKHNRPDFCMTNWKKVLCRCVHPVWASAV
jgi:hypothetical protein